MKKILSINTITYLLIIFIIFFSAGCKKDRIEKRKYEIIGSWKRVPMSISELDKQVVWNFFDDDILITENNSILDTANYFIDTKHYRYYLNISGLGINLDGKYLIDKLKDDILMLQRMANNAGDSEGAYIRIEFIKQ